MVVSFFLGLILMAHPGRVDHIISSLPHDTYQECIDDVINTGMRVAQKHYGAAGWELVDAYCIPVLEENSLKGKMGL
jgi:protein involved in ribonucleotide reduction